jgi:hypothetical protein
MNENKADHDPVTSAHVPMMFLNEIKKIFSFIMTNLAFYSCFKNPAQMKQKTLAQWANNYYHFLWCREFCQLWPNPTKPLYLLKNKANCGFWSVKNKVDEELEKSVPLSVHDGLPTLIARGP